MDRIKKEEVRSVVRGFAVWAEQCALWYGHVERIENGWLVRKISICVRLCISSVRGVNLQGRPHKEWISNMKAKKILILENKMNVWDLSEWRAA